MCVKSQRPFCVDSEGCPLSEDIAYLASRLGHKPGVLVSVTASHYFMDLRSLRVAQIPSQPAHARSELPPVWTHLRAFQGPTRSRRLDAQDDTQSVEIFMNELY